MKRHFKCRFFFNCVIIVVDAFFCLWKIKINWCNRTIEIECHVILVDIPLEFGHILRSELKNMPRIKCKTTNGDLVMKESHCDHTMIYMVNRVCSAERIDGIASFSILRNEWTRVRHFFLLTFFFLSFSFHSLSCERSRSLCFFVCVCLTLFFLWMMIIFFFWMRCFRFCSLSVVRQRQQWSVCDFVNLLVVTSRRVSNICLCRFH